MHIHICHILPTANLVLLPAAASHLVTTYSTGHQSCHDPPPRPLPTPFFPNAATLPRHYPSTREDPQQPPRLCSVLPATPHIRSSVCPSIPTPRKVILIRAMPSPQSATLLVSPRAYHPPALLIAIGSPEAHQKPTIEKFRGIASEPW